MNLAWRHAMEADLDRLAEWNHQLIQDEGARNPVSVAQLSERMKGWLQGEYRGVIFTAGDNAVAYAVYRPENDHIHLRQLFVCRHRRREGIGRRSIELLRRQIWPRDVRLAVEVLCANHRAVAFWRSMGFRDYSLLLEITPGLPPLD